MTTTDIKTGRASEAGHWYEWPTARPAYKVPNKSKPGTFRPTTLADARKLRLLPSVTGILRIIPSEAIIQYRVRQAVLAALTIPAADLVGLDDEAIMQRVSDSADEERHAAADLGTRIHAVIGAALDGQPYDADLLPYVEPMLRGMAEAGYTLECTGRPVVSALGYGGLTDAVFRTPGGSRIVCDFKTQKRRDGKFAHWPEVGLQLAAYAQALIEADDEPYRCMSVAIATDEPGPYEIHSWFLDGDHGLYMAEFVRRLECWKFARGYDPTPTTPRNGQQGDPPNG